MYHIKKDTSSTTTDKEKTVKVKEIKITKSHLTLIEFEVVVVNIFIGTH